LLSPKRVLLLFSEKDIDQPVIQDPFCPEALFAWWLLTFIFRQLYIDI
jgi:hypothetical protein